MVISMNYDVAICCDLRTNHGSILMVLNNLRTLVKGRFLMVLNNLRNLVKGGFLEV